MVLQDLLDSLATGEFAGLSLANSVTGSIKEEAYPRIIKAINRSLTELYKRFLLKKKKVYLVQQEGVSTYYLRASYVGLPGGTSEAAYLLDHPDEAFQNDLIRIIGIKDAEDLFIDINPLHPGVDQTYFRTAQFDTLELITSKTDQVFTIVYQADYPKITITETFDPEALELYYPAFIEEALINYVASLLIKGKTSKASEGEGYASNTFTAKYDIACLKLIELGFAEEAFLEDNRFSMKGFV